MRILKYLLLLTLLIAIATIVFIGTSEGKFVVSKQYNVALPKSTLFHYINEYKNWEDWLFLNQEKKEIQVKTDTNSSGIGSEIYFSKGNDSGFLKTSFVKFNDSIQQKGEWNGIEIHSTLRFTENDSKSVITWTTKGEMSFYEKLKSYLKGGIENNLNTVIEKSLKNLEEKLFKEINTFNITVDGIKSINSTVYLKVDKMGYKEVFIDNVLTSVSQLHDFTHQNKIPTKDYAFVGYQKINKSNDLISYFAAIPLKEEIYTSAGSEYIVDSLMNQTALKITLKGDYSHRKKALDKGLQYIQKNNLEENSGGIYREVLIKTRNEIRFPSQWITELYIPIKSSANKNNNLLQSLAEPLPKENLLSN